MPPRKSARLKSTTISSTTTNPSPLAPYLTPPTLSAPLLRLSPELLDQILSHLLLPHSTPTLRRQLAHSLLGVCRALTPLVRRRVFAKVGLTVDDPKGRDFKLVEIVTEHEGVGGCVRSLRIRAPTPPEPLHADISGGGPGAALVPETSLKQAEVVRRVSGVVGKCEKVRELEVETRCGMRVEDEDEREEEGLQELEKVLGGLKGVRKLGVAVAHARLKLQVFASPPPSSSSSSEERQGWISPWIPSLALWSHLTHLDLWRILLHFPSSYTPPEPTFALVEVQLQSSELGGERELVWLFGRPGGKRGGKLEKLLIRDVEFVETPESSEPLLAIFPCPSSSADAETSKPAFHDSLDSLVLIVPHPLLPPASYPSPSSLEHFLTPFTVLRQLELGGPGMSLPILSSLFSSPSPPGMNIEILNLSYTPSLPIAPLLALFRKHLTAEHTPKLRTLDILRAGSHPRTWEWERISSTPTPVWEWTVLEWRSLEKVVRSLLDLRRRSGGVGVRLCRDGTEVEIEYDSQAEEEGSEESEEEETDGEALFEPSSEPGEQGEGLGWGREESIESDW